MNKKRTKRNRKVPLPKRSQFCKITDATCRKRRGLWVKFPPAAVGTTDVPVQPNLLIQESATFVRWYQHYYFEKRQNRR